MRRGGRRCRRKDVHVGQLRDKQVSAGTRSHCFRQLRGDDRSSGQTVHTGPLRHCRPGELPALSEIRFIISTNATSAWFWSFSSFGNSNTAAICLANVVIYESKENSFRQSFRWKRFGNLSVFPVLWKLETQTHPRSNRLVAFWPFGRSIQPRRCWPNNSQLFTNPTSASWEFVKAHFFYLPQEEYDRLRILAYPGTDVFLVCFSVMSPDSLQNVVEKWLPELRYQAPKAPLILVATKVDLRDNVIALQQLQKKRQKPVSTEEGHKFAKKHKFDIYVECSALTQKGLKNVFDEAILAVLSPKKHEQSHGHFLFLKQCIGHR